MFDAIFQLLRGSNSLELAMASYQLLIDLDKVRKFTPLSLSFDDRLSGLVFTPTFLINNAQS